MRKPTKVQIDSSKFVRLLDNAAFTNNELGGMLIVQLSIDSSGRPELAELVRMHEHIRSGDISCAWGGTKEKIILHIKFVQPIVTEVIIPFEITSDYGLIESILHTRAFYLAFDSSEDHSTNKFECPRILVSIPETGFSYFWEDIYLNSMAKELRKAGLSRKASIKAAKSRREELQNLVTFRMPTRCSDATIHPSSPSNPSR